ncbi:MAG: hypothetical protein QMD13_07425 [Candidatus Bathyarchaeia archaeon]|nr:hypothetical protein [Candidatus Bathyarchaeia archaeon]
MRNYGCVCPQKGHCSEAMEISLPHLAHFFIKLLGVSGALTSKASLSEECVARFARHKPNIQIRKPTDKRIIHSGPKDGHKANERKGDVNPSAATTIHFIPLFALFNIKKTWISIISAGAITPKKRRGNIGYALVRASEITETQIRRNKANISSLTILDRHFTLICPLRRIR